MNPTTTKKQRDFVGEPMGMKLVTALPGIGIVLGQNLTNNGYITAFNVYGQYLVLNKNAVEFNQWFIPTAKANQKQAADCFNALDGWSGNHF